jgi:lysosomal Pro-X carboxypeptidase
LPQATPEKGDGWFLQRYFFCDEHWAREDDGSRGPIFFYVGNEADVTL